MSNDHWVPACGGTEVPSTTRAGRRILYCWQPSTGQHRYLDLGTDTVLPVNFDPALDGTDLDPTLPPKRCWLAVMKYVRDLHLMLSEEQRDGSVHQWLTSIDSQRRPLVAPTSLVSGKPVVLDAAEAIRVVDGNEVASPQQALDVARIALTAANGEMVRCNLPPILRSVAQQVCSMLGGDAELVWTDINVVSSSAPASSYNW